MSASPAPARGGGEGTAPKGRAHKDHFDGKVRVGPYEVVATGTQYLMAGDYEHVQLIVPLTEQIIMPRFGRKLEVLALPLVDFGGVPENWKESVELVIEELRTGKKIMIFCVGSHGRTGCMLGSLIALLESTQETPDPIAAARTRHCEHAVETREQAEAIFALRGQPLPQEYRDEFARREEASKKK